jgi:2-polyprenyl-3-methyl-5-hydroxy-6-metoxy-1,4-benzoquinol methylase
MVNEITTAQSFIEGRGKVFCRGCLGKSLFSALDLGVLPLANELLRFHDSETEKFPLHLSICADCGLGQVADVVSPERIFRDYRYLSSMSSTFLQHAADFVTKRLRECTFSKDDWVLEIASNDGYLLKNFITSGIRVIGVEPAENVAEISRGHGIETISEFFSSMLASKLLSEHGYPKLIIANNVMAHVPDLIDFIKGLAILCGPKTQISIENPSLANVLVGMQFDTIYHEHYSYLSATSVANLCKMYGLHLSKIEELSIHGGSNRYWLEKMSSDSVIDLSVIKVKKFEEDNRLFDSKEWTTYSLKVSGILDDFLCWLRLEKQNGRKIYGYGAAAKASTILNSIQNDENLVTAIADVSLEKQQRFMPPHGIKIISPEELITKNPTDVVIFPWNISTEIADYLRANLGDEVRLWCAIPEMRQVKV